jgi:hypothetical protein
VKITLSAEDAERMQCPQVVEFDDKRIMAREAIAIQKATGWSMDGLGRALGGTPVTSPDGSPVYETDEDGVEIRDQFGNRIRLREINMEALLLAAWIAVRRSGVTVPWDDFDLDLLGAQWGDDEVVEPGKGPPSGTTTSKSGPPTTNRRSRTSSTSGRGRSTS